MIVNVRFFLLSDILQIHIAEDSIRVDHLKQQIAQHSPHLHLTYPTEEIRLSHAPDTELRNEDMLSGDSSVDAIIQDAPRFIDFLMNTPNHHVHWRTVAANLPFSQILEILTREPNFFEHADISTNPSVTWDDVMSHPEIDWNFGNLSSNPHITWDIVQAHPERNWSYIGLSSNPNITIDIVTAHPDKDWNYHHLGMNASITCDIIEQHPEIPWNYCTFVSQNPNLTEDFVRRHSEEQWDWSRLSCEHKWARQMNGTSNVKIYELETMTVADVTDANRWSHFLICRYSKQIKWRDWYFLTQMGRVKLSDIGMSLSTRCGDSDF